MCFRRDPCRTKKAHGGSPRRRCWRQSRLGEFAMACRNRSREGRRAELVVPGLSEKSEVRTTVQAGKGTLISWRPMSWRSILRLLHLVVEQPIGPWRRSYDTWIVGQAGGARTTELVCCRLCHGRGPKSFQHSAGGSQPLYGPSAVPNEARPFLISTDVKGNFSLLPRARDHTKMARLSYCWPNSDPCR